MWQAMALQGGSAVTSGIGAGLAGKKKKDALEDATAEIVNEIRDFLIDNPIT